MRLSRSLCAAVGDALANTASHATLDALFQGAGAPGDPPDLSHGTKWKEWLFWENNGGHYGVGPRQLIEIMYKYAKIRLYFALRTAILGPKKWS
jgi:hypothetical protein